MIYKISVIMPAYNAEKYIGEAIESILNQTYKNFEFIIINDGSTDRTEDIILSYDDPRIVYLKNKENSGIVVSLNNGLKHAKGQYIARMDADDISLPTRFEKQLKYMENNQHISVLGTGLILFGENVQENKRVFTTDYKKSKAELLFAPCVAHPTVMIRKEVLDKNNICYENQYLGMEDFAMWCKIATVSEITSLYECLHYYRIHPQQITQNINTETRKRLFNLLDERMRFIKLNLEYNEKEIFMFYCLNEIEQFDVEKIKSFINILKKVVENNKKYCFFDDAKLRNVIELAIIYCINNSKINQNEKKIVYRYANSLKMITNMTKLKLFFHNITGK